MIHESMLVTKDEFEKKIKIKVNGHEFEMNVPTTERLLDTLRDRLGLTSVKEGCSSGECGACTIILDGKAVCSCLLHTVQVDGSSIQTLEGLAKDGKLHPLQEAFIKAGAVQCGYCTPGMILSAKALLDKNPNPTEEEIIEAISGNLCRCTGYVKII
ncbi:MAG: (2Fe-2S)-binding protein, partial [Thermoplasmata archaeon]